MRSVENTNLKYQWPCPETAVGGDQAAHGGPKPEKGDYRNRKSPNLQE